jgi:hypothetical protein
MPRREFVERYFAYLCDISRDVMSTAERTNLRRHRTAIATMLAFWDDQHPTGKVLS